MKYVMEILRQKQAEKQLPVIRMEIDYELVSLYDAMQVDDSEVIVRTKKRLEQLREQLMDIEEVN